MANNMNEYDQIRKMLNTVRRITESVPNKGIIRESQPQTVGRTDDAYVSPVEMGDQPKFSNPAEMEQLTPNMNTRPPGDPERVEGDDFTVINNLEVVFQGSSDPQDMVLKDDEKGKISQLVDDFRKEVSEMGEFNKLILAPSEATLSGIIPDLNLPFTLSAGDKPGLNVGQIEYTDDAKLIIDKLNTFKEKYINTLNDLLLTRREG
jgi:hypothetical protein